MSEEEMREIDELTKKYGEGVPVGVFVGQKKKDQAINKFYYDIAMNNLTPDQKIDALNFLANRIQDRLDRED